MRTKKVSKFKGKTLEEAQMTLDLYQEYIEEREKSEKRVGYFLRKAELLPKWYTS